MTLSAGSLRAVFADASDGYAAVPRLRGAGFPIDLEATNDGDLIVTIHGTRIREQEVDALIAQYRGRVERMSDPRPAS